MADRDWLNRTLCDVFREMRKCFKTYNFSPIRGLIEEAQSMANRMEGALFDQDDLRSAREDMKKIRQDIRKLKIRKEKLEEKVEELEKKDE